MVGNLQTGSGALRSLCLQRVVTAWSLYLAKFDDYQGTMALDNLKYGSFLPVAVQAEARSLPGYGGQVEDWGTYRFMVEALEMKESQLSETERKKLGGLALRLTERLQGPALQIARSIGVEKLSKTDGVKVLLESLEKDLLPIRRQAALELYQAGSTSGLLSRQSAKPIDEFLLSTSRSMVEPVAGS